ncbi:MAG: hypothetical protein IJ087_13325 [Eggerthellaceae bacterium]|nr:hypothetical protein [Eggerthellaceae bacterium]
MKQIEITAKMAKTNIDAKKAAVTLELMFDSWSAIPDLAKMTGMTVQAVLYPSQDELDFDED